DDASVVKEAATYTANVAIAAQLNSVGIDKSSVAEGTFTFSAKSSSSTKEKSATLNLPAENSPPSKEKSVTFNVSAKSSAPSKEQSALTDEKRDKSLDLLNGHSVEGDDL